MLSLAETAAAQAGPTRGDPVDNNEAKIVVTIWPAADTTADQVQLATLALASLLSSAESAAQTEQSGSEPVDNSDGKIVIIVRPPGTPAHELYRATMTLDSLRSLAETAAAQARQTRAIPSTAGPRQILPLTRVVARFCGCRFERRDLNQGMATAHGREYPNGPRAV